MCLRWRGGRVRVFRLRTGALQVRVKGDPTEKPYFISRSAWWQTGVDPEGLIPRCHQFPVDYGW